MRKKKLNLLHFSQGEKDFDEEVDDFKEDEEQEDEKKKILNNYENITPTKKVSNKLGLSCAKLRSSWG